MRNVSNISASEGSRPDQIKSSQLWQTVPFLSELCSAQIDVEYKLPTAL